MYLTSLTPEQEKINSLRKVLPEAFSFLAEKPVKVIELDRIFKGNDQLKTNTVLQIRDVGIEFKMI